MTPSTHFTAGSTPDAPRSDDYRYALGDREWRDIEPAMRYAIEHGAEELVLMGWSMGGATVLQALTRSALGARVIGVVLESLSNST